MLFLKINTSKPLVNMCFSSIENLKQHFPTGPIGIIILVVTIKNAAGQTIAACAVRYV